MGLRRLKSERDSTKTTFLTISSQNLISTASPDPTLISPRFDRIRVRLWFDRFDWLTALRLSKGRAHHPEEDRGEAHSKSGPEVLEGKEFLLMGIGSGLDPTPGGMEENPLARVAAHIESTEELTMVPVL